MNVLEGVNFKLVHLGHIIVYICKNNIDVHWAKRRPLCYLSNQFELRALFHGLLNRIKVLVFSNLLYLPVS